MRNRVDLEDDFVLPDCKCWHRALSHYRTMNDIERLAYARGEFINDWGLIPCQVPDCGCTSYRDHTEAPQQRLI